MPETSHAHNLCVAASRHDVPCRRIGLPGAPFPICVEHAAELLGFLNRATDGHEQAAIAAARQVDAEDNCKPQPMSIPGRGRSVVYYLRVGRLIKIGHSNNLAQRLRFYPPDAELLAVEAGDLDLEATRLRQFKHTLRGRDEWFAPSVELLQHIKGLTAYDAAA